MVGNLTRVVGVISGKGGVGKTTFSINLAIALTRLGKKVVVVDCNISTPHLAYYIGAGNYSATLNNVFRDEVDIKFVPVEREGVMFIPASDELRDLIKVDISELKRHISRLSNDAFYDFIILDSAPGLGREALSSNFSRQVFLIMSPPNGMFSFALTYRDYSLNTIRYDSKLLRHNQGIATSHILFQGIYQYLCL